MTSPQTTEMCQKCLEALTGNDQQQVHDPEILNHLAACSSCAQMLATVEHLRQQGSAFADESYPELKIKIMRRLEPALEQRRASSNVGSAGTTRSWFWQLSFSLAVLLIVAVSFFSGHQLVNVQTPAGELVTAAAPISFFMVINGGAITQVSLDNPVALFTDDKATINVPDGSTLQVTGPARLNVLPRGFHLLQGRLQAEVVAGKGEFTGTTPHGQITVLGTVFTVETDQRRTLVEVTSGRVKVQSDGHEAVFLNASERTEMCQSGVSTETETIPAVDKE